MPNYPANNVNFVAYMAGKLETTLGLGRFSQGELGLTYRIACPLDSDGQTQDEGPSYGDWTVEEPLVAVGTGTAQVTGTEVPQQIVSRSGRAIDLYTPRQTSTHP
ncbi:unnamed protein product [Arctogadus glacialis]